MKIKTIIISVIILLGFLFIRYMTERNRIIKKTKENKLDFSFYSEEFIYQANSIEIKRFASNRKDEIEKLYKNHEIRSKAVYYGLLGQTYTMINDLNKAYTYYTNALKYSIEKWGAYQGLGLVYYLKKNYNKSIDYYKKQIKINEDDGSSYFFLSECYYHLRDYDSAVMYLNKFNKFTFIFPKGISEEEKKSMQNHINRIKKYAGKLNLLIQKKIKIKNQVIDDKF